MRCTLLGLGTAEPAHSIAQDHAAALAVPRCCGTPEQARVLPALYRRAHVDRRGSVLLERVTHAADAVLGNGAPAGVEAENSHDRGLSQSFFPPAGQGGPHGPTTDARMRRYALDAVPLALRAARAALAQAKLPPAAITQLVTVSCTGFAAPGVDVAIMRELRLPATAGRTNVGFMGCHGALNGLRVAAAMTAADPAARVLLCAVELCSLHFHYGWDPEKIVANALFADGAAAMVLGGEPDADAGQSRRTDTWRLAGSGSCVFPDSEEAMSWTVGDHGFVMTLSARVPDLIAAHLRPWLEHWLAGQGLRIPDIGAWAVHPGGPRIVSSTAQCLGLPPAATLVSNGVLARHGNMSSPTLLFILDELRRTGASLPCVALGFGPGLTVEAALWV